MKKRSLPVLLALALCIGLAAPALAADEAPPVTISASGPGSELPKADRELTLRNFTEECEFNNRYSAIRYIFTRNAEPELVNVKDAITLPFGTEITVSGLRPSGDGGDPWDVACLYAWSDPDGDGVYDQRLFTHNGGRDNFTTLPVSEAGPVSCRLVETTDPYSAAYRLNANICGPDTLTCQWFSTGDVAFPSSVTLSAEFLTRLFGPNTLIRLDVGEARGYTHIDIPVSEQSSYYFLIPEGQAVPPPFADIPGWCARAVDWAVAENITQGIGDNKFGTDDKCTGSMILTFLWRAEGEPKASAKAPVTAAPWYQDAIDWAYEKGLIDASFDPDAYCTRASAVDYLWRAAFWKFGGSECGFTDVPADADYAPAVYWAVAYHVTEGTGDNTFSPGKICTRGEIVTLLHRAYVPSARLK